MISATQIRLYLPLLGFVVPTLAMGYGVVLPRHGICGVNEITLGFGSTVLGAVLTYVTGIRMARQTSCSRKPLLRRLSEYVNRQASAPRGGFGRFLGHVWRFELRRVNELTLELLEIGQRHDVLELGCGSGTALGKASRMASDGHVLGLDVSEVMVEMATAHNRRAIAEGRAEVRHINGVLLGVAPQSFDRAFSVHSLYFWKDPLEILRQLREGLRPGGRLVLTFRPESDGISSRFRDPTYRFYQESEVEALLQQAGFVDVRVIRPASDETVRCALATVPNVG